MMKSLLVALLLGSLTPFAVLSQECASCHSLTTAAPVQNVPTQRCISPEAITESGATHGIEVYRRLTDVTDDEGHFDIVLFFKNPKNDQVLAIWFNKGCLVDEEQFDKETADGYIKEYGK